MPRFPLNRFGAVLRGASAADYLSRLSAQEPVVPVTTTMPAHLLAQVLDLLSYVLTDDFGWSDEVRLMAPRTAPRHGVAGPR